MMNYYEPLFYPTVYLRTDPEVAHKRITQRGRSEENAIKLEYLQSVHKLHEDWLIHKQNLLPCPVRKAGMMHGFLHKWCRL